MGISLPLMARTTKKSPAKPPSEPKDEPQPAPDEHPLPFMRNWRNVRKISQEVLGEIVGASQGMISQWENGESDIPMGRVHDIARALNVSVVALITIDPGPDQEMHAVWQTIPEKRRPLALRMIKNIAEEPE